MLLEDESKSRRSKEIEAFNATITIFRIRIVDLAADSGVLKRDIENFKKGSDRVTSRTLSKIILGLTPMQRSFYSAMISLQYCAEDAGVKLPLLSLRKADDATDIYRDALDITLSTFDIKKSELAKSSGIAQPNIANWQSKKRDFYLMSIDKIKSGLEREQRNFYNAVVEILYILTAA